MTNILKYARRYGIKATLVKSVKKLVFFNQIKECFLKYSGRRYVTSEYGVLLRAAWEDPTFRACYYATYGPEFSAFLKNRRQPFALLDIGANQGLYSLIASNNPCCVKCFAFEPVKSTYDLLVQNVEKNGFTDKAVCVNAAVSNQSGAATILLKKGHSGSASLREQDAERDHIRSERIDVIDYKSLDEIAGHELLELGDVEIIVKVDVEGHEQVVIAELLKSKMANSVSAVFYEVDEAWSDSVGIKKMLKSIGINAFRSIGDPPHYDVLATKS